MSGLKQITELYKENNNNLPDFLSTDTDVIITEKLDAYRFSIEKKSDNKVYYYKKNDSRPIDKVDRLISDLYEKAILYFERDVAKIKKYLPEGIRFGFAYFPNNKPLRIDYKNTPKNNLVLTDITQRNKNNQKIVKVFEDISYINRWAGILNVSKMPIIYAGKLKEEQLEFINELCKGSEKIQANFAEHISGVFGKTYTENDIIEGIVVKTKDNTVKLQDPCFEVFEEYSSNLKESRDFFDLVVLELEKYIRRTGIPKKRLDLSNDELYIECVSNIFNGFVNENLIDINSDPSFLTPNIIGNRGKIGLKFIKNPITKKLVTENKLYEELFKVFLNILRKKRKPYGLLTEEAVDNLNKYIDNISEYTNFDIVYEKVDTESDTNKSEFINKIFKTEFENKREDSEHIVPVTVLLGKMNPLNNNHLDIIKEEFEKTNRKILVVNTINQIHDTVETPLSYKIDSGIIKQIMSKFTSENKKYVIGYFTLDYLTIKRLYNLCYYNKQELRLYPEKFIIDNTEFDFWNMQINDEKTVFNNRLSIKQDIEIVNFKDKYNYTILKTIENNDLVEFKKMVPSSIVDFWEVIYNNWKEWSMK